MQNVFEDQDYIDPNSEEFLYYSICCQNRSELAEDEHISLDMELVLSDTKESIGEKLMKNHYKKDIQSEILTENKVWLQRD